MQEVKFTVVRVNSGDCLSLNLDVIDFVFGVVHSKNMLNCSRMQSALFHLGQSNMHGNVTVPIR